jgi:uncharacterized protein (TIGR00369 family)
MKVQYLRPLRMNPVRCEASFVKQGRTINFLESRVFDHESKLAATATSTWQLLPLEGDSEWRRQFR